MSKFLTFLVFMAWSTSSMAHPQYMRRQDATKDGPDPEDSEDRMLVAGIASGGAILTHDAEQQAHDAEAARTLVAWRKSRSELQSMLEESHKTDVYDKDGFEIESVTDEQRMKELAESQAREADSVAVNIKKNAQKVKPASLVNKDKKAKTAYSGDKAVVSGFWAEDRPNEERIDPENMKIYTFKTYKHKFPYRHSWETEVEWKKLPFAPKKVHKVRKQGAKAAGKGALMEEGTMLVDESHQELTWMKDSNGFYHMGTEPPTAEQMHNIQFPTEKKNNELLQQQEEASEKGMYKDYSDKVVELRNKMADAERPFGAQMARQELEMVLAEMQDTVSAKPGSSGKGFVSIRGGDGLVTSFNADIEKVTAMAVKRRIEKVTGIPWEAQRLFIKGEELVDSNKLNKYLGAGRGVWIDFQQRDYEVIKAALLKRGKVAKPTVVAPENQIKAAPQSVLEKKVVSQPASEEEQDDQEEEASLQAKSAKTEQPQEIQQLVANVEEDKALSSDDSSEMIKIDQSVLDEDELHAEAGHDSEFKLSEELHEEQVHKAKGFKAKTEAEKTVDESNIRASFKKAEKELAQAKERRAQHEIAKSLKPQVTMSKSHATGTRQVIYVRGDDGKWKVDKEEVATADHPIDNTVPFDVVKDEGIPVQDRLSEVVDSEENKPVSFLQFDSHSSPEGEKKDDALREAIVSKKLLVLENKNAAQAGNAARMVASRKWREAANPVEPYEGAEELAELSNKRAKKEKAYDGMQAVMTGFWADDRPNERRVDMSDHRIYTWSQYRKKYPFKHSMYVEDMWKKLPTEKRVKKLGKKAFIQRFR